MTVRSSRAQRARSGEIQTRARRDVGTSPVRGQPSTSAAGSTSGRGSKLSIGDVRRLEAVEAEVADVVAGRVEAREIPAVAAVDERIRLDEAGRELILVLLVVLEGEQPSRGDRTGDDRSDLRIVAAGRRRSEAPRGRDPRRARRRPSSRTDASDPSGMCSPMRSIAATSAFASTGSSRAGRANESP